LGRKDLDVRLGKFWEIVSRWTMDGKLRLPGCVQDNADNSGRVVLDTSDVARRNTQFGCPSKSTLPPIVSPHGADEKDGMPEPDRVRGEVERSTANALQITKNIPQYFTNGNDSHGILGQRFPTGQFPGPFRLMATLPVSIANCQVTFALESCFRGSP